MDSKTKILLKTKRHLFGKEITDLLKEFALTHKEEDRKTFKANWENWRQITEVHGLINIEMNKQENSDVLDKMYKSTWYYYRKKDNNTKDDVQEKPERKKYEAFDSNIVKTMDKHIRNKIQENVTIDKITNLAIGNITPAESFDQFCKEYRELLLEHIVETFVEQEINNDNAKLIVEKFKKAYKNKFYTIRVELMNNE